MFLRLARKNCLKAVGKGCRWLIFFFALLRHGCRKIGGSMVAKESGERVKAIFESPCHFLTGQKVTKNPPEDLGFRTFL
jgi:hypothetical protein